MSVDGPGILESDLAHDVYNEILDLFDAGVPGTDLPKRIISFESSLLDDMDLEIYLAASAKALWDIGYLDQPRVLRLKRLVESGTSIARWAQSGDEHLAEARKAVLVGLLRQISAPRKVTRGPKKYSTVKEKLFAVGDCLELRAVDRIYRGVVCKILEYRGACEYAILVMEPSTLSSTRSFETSRFYGRRIPSSHHKSGQVPGPHVIRPEHRMLVREGNPFHVVGHVNLDPSRFILGSFGGVLAVSHVIQDFDRTQTNEERFGNLSIPLAELLVEHSEAEV